MVFGKEPLIPPEDTVLGSYFKETFEMLWNEGKSAKEIAEELQFDDVENTPWEGKLKLWHVYYFARKWGLKPRRRMGHKKGQVE
jgi:hypothetical protein